MSKELLGNVLGPARTGELWSVACGLALPLIPQDFAIGGVLPAVMYMRRWGRRRGKGNLEKEFGNPDARRKADRAATIASVAEKLARTEQVCGFDEPVQQAILGDLLLAYNLENQRHKLGRDESVQRVYPTHYFSSWVDLPDSVANLRGVPELITAALSNGRPAPQIQTEEGIAEDHLLRVFTEGVRLRSGSESGSESGSKNGLTSSLDADQFDEAVDVGVDQLLAVRIAQRLGRAPEWQKVDAWVPRALPAAARATEILSEDMRTLLRAYGAVIPRLTLVPMLESCMGMGLTSLFLHTLQVMEHWATHGSVPTREAQTPFPVLADCSQGTHAELRRLSEQSLDEMMLRLARLPVIFMCIKIAEGWAREQRIAGFTRQDLNPNRVDPDPSHRLNRLGEILQGASEEARDFRRDTKGVCTRLAEALEEEGADARGGGRIGDAELADVLETEERHPAWNLAEAIVALIGEQSQGGNLRKFLDSAAMADQPHGLVRKRRSTRGGRWLDRRSVVLTNTMLDFLVHRHLRKAAKGTPEHPLTLIGLLDLLRTRYGIHVDAAPPGMSVPGEMLRRNRRFLEGRLRDLGLLIGANDAEAMKRLRSRFDAADAESIAEEELGDG